MALLEPDRFDEIDLLDGTAVGVGVVVHVFDEWTGPPPPRSYGAKPVVDHGGSGVFAEIALVAMLRAEGFDAVWASTYGGLRFFDEQPLRDRSNNVTPPHVLADAVAEIGRANGTTSGTFDVIASCGGELRFIEAKRARRDAIRDTQRRWLATALELGHPVESFFLFEWRFAPR